MWDVKTSDKYELLDFFVDGQPLDISQFSEATPETTPKVYL